MAENTQTADTKELELVITRIFDAPRERVFAAWTDPQQVEQWFGPQGFATRVEEQDLRPGGVWRYVMIGPDGTEYPCHGVYREIQAPEWIVASDEFGDGVEELVSADLPGGMVVTTHFDDHDGKTKTRLTVRIMHATAEDRRKHEEMGVVAGWNSSFDCLDEWLAKA